MSDDKDDLKSIKVYKLDNTKESWHEFALKFRVNADSRGYEDIIDGTKNLLMKKKTLKYFQRMMRKYRRQKRKSWVPVLKTLKISIPLCSASPH